MCLSFIYFNYLFIHRGIRGKECLCKVLYIYMMMKSVENMILFYFVNFYSLNKNYSMTGFVYATLNDIFKNFS